MLYSLIAVFAGLSAVQCDNYNYNYRHNTYNYNERRNAENCLPPIYDGLVVKPFKRTYDHEEVIEISCKEGFEMTNKQPNSTCRVFDVFGSHGVFMPAITPTTCKGLPMCRAPYGYGLVVTPMKPLYDIGENITLSCKEGFVPSSETMTYTCKDTYYRYRASFGVSGMSVCQEIQDCAVPLQEGLKIEPFQMMYEPGTEITLSCDEGYELAVAEKSTCEPTGHFSFERSDDNDYDMWKGIHYIFTTQACRKKAKCHPPSFPGLIVTPKKEKYQTGDEITLSCEDDYELTAPNKSVCGYEEHRSGNMYDFFSFLDAMSGIGQFEPKVRSYTCRRKPRCYVPRERGMIITPDKTAYALGDTIEVSCEEGYELVGESTRTCSRHQKTDMIYRRMGYSYGPSHGHFLPEMDNVCKKKEMCRPPFSRAVVLKPKKSLYHIGDTVTVSCLPGYKLKQANETTCQSNDRRSRYGRFSPDIDGEVCEKIPSCDVPARKGLVVSPQKDYYAIGDKVSLTCEDGYEQRVAPTSTCMTGRSSKYGRFDPDIGREPCRKPTKCQPPGGDNLTLSPQKEIYDEGDKVEVSCAEGYKRVAPKRMRCVRSYHCRGQSGEMNGCFHPTPPRVSCIKKGKCKAPKAKNLVVSPQREEYEEGDMVSLSCEEGYDLKLSYDTISCRSMRRSFAFNVGLLTTAFSPYVPRDVCRKKSSCDVPDLGQGVIITPTKEKYYDGDRIEISCEEGYKLKGESKSRCLTKTKYFIPEYVSLTKTMFKPKLDNTRCKKVVVEETERETAEEGGIGTTKPDTSEETDLNITTPESTDTPIQETTGPDYQYGSGGGMIPELPESPEETATETEAESITQTTEPTPPASESPYRGDSEEQVNLEEDAINRA